MSLYDHIAACNAHDPSGFRPFFVAGERVGWVRHELAERCRRWDDVFEVADDRLAMRDTLADADARSDAMARVGAALAGEDLLPPERGELFPVATAVGAAALLRLDRAWVPGFGVTSCGVHVNGYVESLAGPQVWIATRSADSRVAPGKLDNMVAGGLPVGLSLMDNLIKEADEEASVPSELARTARPAGAISYAMEVPEGLRRDVLFVYDLQLPESFRPVNRDGEFSGFEKMTAARALRLVDASDAFKFNVNLVIIDFAIRHGVLAPEHPDYLKLLRGLQSWS